MKSVCAWPGAAGITGSLQPELSHRTILSEVCEIGAAEFQVDGRTGESVPPRAEIGADTFSGVDTF